MRLRTKLFALTPFEIPRPGGRSMTSRKMRFFQHRDRSMIMLKAFLYSKTIKIWVKHFSLSYITLTWKEIQTNPDSPQKLVSINHRTVFGVKPSIKLQKVRKSYAMQSSLEIQLQRPISAASEPSIVCAAIKVTNWSISAIKLRKFTAQHFLWFQWSWIDLNRATPTFFPPVRWSAYVA